VPILEELKEYAERATGLSDQANGRLRISRVAESPTSSASRTTAWSPTIRDGR
jgi:hypothetical protein